jgi:hypothetical protein
MTALTKRATVYLEPELHKALRLKSVETSRSLSELLNDAIRDELAEDAEDLAVFDARKNEPTMTFEDFETEANQPSDRSP